MPRSFGDSVIHSSHFDFAVRYDCSLPCVACSQPNELELEIGKIIAHRLIDDGATLQLGVGNIPDAVLCALFSHKDLGVHSEIISDAMVDLVEQGNITNKFKMKHKGRMVGSMALGTKRLYDFLHNNPFLGNYNCNNRFIRRGFVKTKFSRYFSIVVTYVTHRAVSDQLRERSSSDLDAAEDDGRQLLHRDGHHRPSVLGQFGL